MPVVFIEHAFHTYSDAALLTEIFYRLVYMAGTVHEVLTVSCSEQEHLWGEDTIFLFLEDYLHLLVLHKFCRVCCLYWNLASWT